MEIKLKNKKVVKIKDFTIAEEAKLKDIFLKMIKMVDGGVELISPNYNCLLILQMVLKDGSDKALKKMSDDLRIEIALEVQKLLFLGNEKPSK